MFELKRPRNYSGKPLRASDAERQVQYTDERLRNVLSTLYDKGFRSGLQLSGGAKLTVHPGVAISSLYRDLRLHESIDLAGTPDRSGRYNVFLVLDQENSPKVRVPDPELARSGELDSEGSAPLNELKQAEFTSDKLRLVAIPEKNLADDPEHVFLGTANFKPGDVQSHWDISSDESAPYQPLFGAVNGRMSDIESSQQALGDDLSGRLDAHADSISKLEQDFSRAMETAKEQVDAGVQSAKCDLREEISDTEGQVETWRTTIPTLRNNVDEISRRVHALQESIQRTSAEVRDGAASHGELTDSVELLKETIRGLVEQAREDRKAHAAKIEELEQRLREAEAAVPRIVQEVCESKVRRVRARVVDLEKLHAPDAPEPAQPHSKEEPESESGDGSSPRLPDDPEARP